MSVTYDINTTYIIYTENIGPSFEDLAKNTYVLDQNFTDFPTYSNSERLLVPTFGIFQRTFTESSPYNNMREVVLGDNIEAGICKFYNCNELESVTINYRNDRISIGAFGFCQNLTSVTIPDTIRSIEDLAFYACNKLTTFNFDNITYIGFGAFQNCGEFTTLQFKNNSYFFVSDSFDNCIRLTNISFTNDKCVGVIQPNAFVSTGITNVTLPPNMLWTPTPTGSQYGGSFPLDCDVSGGRIGSGVVGTFTLSAIGTDATGLAVTASASSTATATGKDVPSALDDLLAVANDFLKPSVTFWAQNNGDVTSYNLEFTITK
jgi:hypothetical protein